MSHGDQASDSPESPEQETARLRRAVEELSILNELARSIGASLDSQQVMRTIVQRALHAVNGEQSVITLVGNDEVTETTTLIRTQLGTSEHPKFHLDQVILGWMYLHGRPLLVNDPHHDDRFRGVRFDQSIHSILCVPMMVKCALRGVLTVYNKRDVGGFTEDDQRLLAIIAAQSAQVVENAQLYEKEKLLLKMQEELRLASKIQIELLPKSVPDIPGYDLAAVNIPAQAIGGDYFDFIPVGLDRWALCLGDVSGKGLTAALLMANLQATVRSQTLLGPSPKECLARSNTLLFRSTNDEKFATLFYGILDADRHQLVFSNAGHDNPLLISSSAEPRRLRTGGLVLGVVEEFPYEEEQITLTPGDVVVMYSDGIVESMSDAGEPYGEARLAALLGSQRDQVARRILESVINDAKQHTGGRQQADDMTVVVVKRLK